MRAMSRLKKALALAAIGAAIGLCSEDCFAGKDPDSIQSEIDAINVQLEYLKIKVNDTKKKSRSLETRIKSKKDEIKKLGSQIDQLTANQSETIAQIKKLEQENADSRRQLKELMERFQNRLVQLHKIKQGTLVSSVMFAKDLNSFLSRYQMVKYLLQADKNLIQELKEQDERVRTVTKRLQDKNKALENNKDEIGEKQKLLAKEQVSLSAMLNAVLMEKKLFLQREKDLANARKKLEKQVDEAVKVVSKPEFEKELDAPVKVTAPAITEEKPVEVKKQKAVETPAVVAAPKVVADNEFISASAPEAAKVMSFMWPIAKNLRERILETGDESSYALMIKPAADAEIAAIAKGKVLYKGFLSGLGNVIILGHQRGFSSVYANVDDVWVGLNEVVDRGTVIGKIIGGSNNALHFEIRFGGKKVPPLAYLPE